ncbi:hypothetical protein [Pseudorhodoplanes sp.]|uniref:hypothetical protein n=1 Tax=Pseudorhodoplanes sp. TaxID=1934341 RepID=UPI003D0C8EFC
MTNNERAKSCEQRIDAELKDRLNDLRRLWAAFIAGREDDDLGSLSDYGLCFGYVSPGTFDEQDEAYYRYQLSWGGPSDEFRFFVNPDLSCHRIEYWFLDWFDGAYRVLTAESRQLMLDLWDWFRETGLARTAFEGAAL